MSPAVAVAIAIDVRERPTAPSHWEFKIMRIVQWLLLLNPRFSPSSFASAYPESLSPGIEYYTENKFDGLGQ